MTKSLVIFGDRPGPRTDPAQALYPHTTTGAAAKLISLLGVTREFYLENAQRYNVRHDGERLLSLDEARYRVKEVMVRTLTEHRLDSRFLFVGGEALRGAPQFYRRMQFLETQDLVMYIPHTSGVNRWYNSAENTQACRETLGVFTQGWRGKGSAQTTQQSLSERSETQS